MEELMNGSPPLERGRQRSDLIFIFFHRGAVGQISPKRVVMPQRQLPSSGFKEMGKKNEY